MKKRTLQQTKILKTLNKKGFITTNEALYLYKPPIKRLAAVMFKIKAKLERDGGKYVIEPFPLPDATVKYVLKKAPRKNQPHYTQYDKVFRDLFNNSHNAKHRR